MAKTKEDRKGEIGSWDHISGSALLRDHPVVAIGTSLSFASLRSQVFLTFAMQGICKLQGQFEDQVYIKCITSLERQINS